MERYLPQGLPWWLSGKEPTYNAGDAGSIPGFGRSSGEGNGNPLQYSCLGNSMVREAWGATVHRVAKSRTPLSDHQHFPLLRTVDTHTHILEFRGLWSGGREAGHIRDV